MVGRDSRPPRGFWELWSVRIVSALVVLMTAVAIAVLGDPGHESWQAKTWEFVHHVAAASVGHQ